MIRTALILFVCFSRCVFARDLQAEACEKLDVLAYRVPVVHVPEMLHAPFLGPKMLSPHMMTPVALDGIDLVAEPNMAFLLYSPTVQTNGPLPRNEILGILADPGHESFLRGTFEVNPGIKPWGERLIFDTSYPSLTPQ